MIDFFAPALAIDGLIWIVAGSFLAGLARGFSGFGTAMIYLPFAASVLPPVWALTALIVMDLIAPLFLIPRALRDGHPPDILRLAGGSLVGVPLGVAMLLVMATDFFRYAVSSVALLLLVALVLGLRYRGVLTRAMVYGTGCLGGLLAGSIGIPGPPVIMLYMASTLPAAAIRANNTVYLVLADLQILGVFAIRGLLESVPVAIGIMATVPYATGIGIGALLFDPERELVYRRIAYAMIALSAVSGLPFFD
ncbi:MAG: sulfite exporter TauE/SafE family protein [Albidovulum sp.]|nr:sulfite exporter TauE/SafE family protein [Albidovulum sp.]